MKLYAVFGNPIEHSLSPRMHNLAFEFFKINGAYIKDRLIDGSKLLERFDELKLSGANVTVPHKESAFKACDEVRGIAQKIGAVNTLVKEKDKIIGYNSDALGFLNSLKDFITPKKTLILGAGGTAKAIAHALNESNFKTTILNRSKNRLDYFLNLGFECFSHEDFLMDEYDLIVNTTPAGLNDDFLPLDESVLVKILSKASAVYDVIYGKNTPFIKKAKEFNLLSKGGKDMLAYQGAIAFNLFNSNSLNEDKIVNVMKEALKLPSFH